VATAIESRRPGPSGCEATGARRRNVSHTTQAAAVPNRDSAIDPVTKYRHAFSPRLGESKNRDSSA
jgi:hypothetical protein